MARFFNGNANLLSPDASTPALDTDAKSAGYWFFRTASATGIGDMVWTTLTAGGAATGPGGYMGAATVAGSQPGYSQRYTLNNGNWHVTNDVSLNARHHVAIVYDRSNVANVPTFYVDGVAVAVTTVQAPTGTLITGEVSIKIGESRTGSTQDLLATSLQHMACAAGRLWTAGEVNRAMWWGRPHGGLLVYLPLVTDKLVDEGVAGETLTNTNTTVVNMVTPVVRPGSALMGLDIGW